METLLLLALLGVSAWLFATSFQDNGNTVSMDNNRLAIQQNITAALGLPDAATDILYAQAALETGDFSSNTFYQTNSMFNRHKGNGVTGVPNSDGYWTGNTYFASSADTDIRIYTDVFQSAQDMAQLLQNPLYAGALAALRRGDAPGYYSALGKAGYAASLTYVADLNAKFSSLA